MVDSLELDAEDFIWNDGGRAASGYVGSTGDCATRAISIATGRAYKEVYDALYDQAGMSPRDGVDSLISDSYLAERGWMLTEPPMPLLLDVRLLPKGVVIVRLKQDRNSRKRSGHLCCVIDHVIHDTWNPAEDHDQYIHAYWTHPSFANQGNSPIVAPKRSTSNERELTQGEFDKVMRRLRALDRTAKNEGSTEAERRNALRAIQAMMLQNNLTREDICDEDNVDAVSFARISCYMNGKRTCTWEANLAMYICSDVLTSVQVYFSTCGKRSRVVFYGPLQDVRNAIQLYREMLVTIAAAARLKYGGYARGSGASYCEGYVRGLPRGEELDPVVASDVVSANALIQTRLLTIKTTAKDWLAKECGVYLRSSSGGGRSAFDPIAASHGKIDGASHKVEKPNAAKRIESK